MNYFAVVHKDEQSAFGVTFPDLEGCFSAADTEAELMANAIEALELYLEDIEAPQASSIADIQAKHADDLGAGAFLISVPFIQRSTKSVRFNSSMSAGVLSAIDDRAKTLKLSRSAYLEHAVIEEMKQSA